MIRKYHIELLLWLVVLFWAGNYTVGKFAMREFSPLAFNAIRFLIATPLILLLLKYREGGLNFSQADLPRVIAVGAVGIAIYQTTFMGAIKYTSATNAALGIGMSPIFTALLGAATGQERLNFSGLIGCLIAFGGLFLVVGFSPEQSGLVSHSLYGDGLALISGFLWGLYPILATPLLRSHSALWLTGHSSLVATLLLLVFALPDLRGINYQSISATAWSSLLYSAIPVTVLSLVSWYYGIEKIGANQAMIYMYLIPPVAIVIAMFTIGEQIALLQCVGAFITVCGVILVKHLPAKQPSR